MTSINEILTVTKLINDLNQLRLRILESDNLDVVFALENQYKILWKRKLSAKKHLLQSIYDNTVDDMTSPSSPSSLSSSPSSLSSSSPILSPPTSPTSRISPLSISCPEFYHHGQFAKEMRRMSI